LSDRVKAYIAYRMFVETLNGTEITNLEYLLHLCKKPLISQASFGDQEINYTHMNHNELNVIET
jgi:hypothetical protein